MTLQPIYTYEEQLEQLATLVEQIHVRTNPHVKGTYTTSDYVTWRLNQIFTPAGWTSRILDGPTVEAIGDGTAYVRSTLRLSVTFANGQMAERDEIGVWPLTAKGGSGGDLHNTPPENYETVLKAAVSDALKACAERLGTTFRVLTDRELHQHLAAQQAIACGPQVGARQAMAELYDNAPAQPAAQAQQPTANGEKLARASFYQITGEMVKAGTLKPARVNELTQLAKAQGWPAALATLHAEAPQLTPMP